MTLVIVLLLLFLVNPLVSLTVAVLVALIDNRWLDVKYRKNLLLVICLLCILTVSLINMKKIPENDLLWYLKNYKQAGYMPLSRYILVGSSADMSVSYKEPLFGVLVWILNRCFGGNETFYKLFISLLSYVFLSGAVVWFGRRLRISYHYIIMGVILMCFTPYIFTMSLQLVRQFLANSLLVYVTVRVCFCHKYDWWAIVAMPLIHTTALLFIPILLIRPFEKPFRQAWLWYIGCLLVILLIPQLSGFLVHEGVFSGMNWLNYGLDRVHHGTSFNLGELSAVKLSLVILVLIVSLWLFLGKSFKTERGMRRFAFLMVFLCTFILTNLNHSEWSGRFFFYLLPFVPLFLMLIFERFRCATYTTALVSIAMMAFFTIFLETGTWRYDTDYNVWLMPAFAYFMH